MAATRPTLPLLQAAANATELMRGHDSETRDRALGAHHDVLHPRDLATGPVNLVGTSLSPAPGACIKQDAPYGIKQEAQTGIGSVEGEDCKPKAKRYLPHTKKPPPPPQVVEEYHATLYFRGALCVESDPYNALNELTHNLFHYTDRTYKDHIIRFDPVMYPIEGGLDGPGAVRLIRDIKNCSLESLNLSRGSPILRDAQRRLFCLRGDVRKSSHIVQTCRCNVNFVLRTDAHSHFMRCGKGFSLHTGHARIINLARHRVLPADIVPRVVSSTGEPMEGFFPDQLVIIRPEHIPPANVTVGSEEVVEYSARITFEAMPCLLDDAYDRSKLTTLELYSYTHPRFKHMVVRFDPIKYPVEGGFDGPGWKRLLADLKDKSEDPLCLHSVAAQDKDRLRRLCCRRGQMHHAKFVVQTCHCPVRLLVHRDHQSFYLKCGDGCAIHQGHPPLPKVYSQKGIPKRKYNPDGSLVVKAELGVTATALSSTAAGSVKSEDEPQLVVPFSKAGKRLWPYVSQLVEAVDGLPWQHVEAAGRQVQEIAEEVELRKQARESQRAAKRARNNNKQRQQQQLSDDEVNSKSSQAVAQQQPSNVPGQAHYNQQVTYHPYPPSQNFYL